MTKPKRGWKSRDWLLVVAGSCLVIAAAIPVWTFRLRPVKAATEPVELVEYKRRGIERLLDDATSTLRYVRTADTQAFDAAIKTLSAEDQKTVRALIQRKK